jgi:methyltransferase-like protein 6
LLLASCDDDGDGGGGGGDVPGASDAGGAAADSSAASVGGGGVDGNDDEGEDGIAGEGPEGDGAKGDGAEGDGAAGDDAFRVWEEDASSHEREAATAAHLAAQPLAPAYWRARYADRAGTYWNDFYERNADHFFSDRHYLLRDFGRYFRGAAGGGADALLPGDTYRSALRLLELGCGCGNALVPLAARLPRLFAVGFDLSRTGVSLLREALARGDAARPALALRRRVVAFARDAAAPGLAADAARALAEAVASGAAAAPAGGAPQPALRRGFDRALMLFMLSAMPPERHGAIVREAAAALRPRGLLLFRDYGHGDAAQLRFARGKMLDAGGALFARQDGTLAFFFTEQRLRALGAAAGLELVEFFALHRRYRNRQLGLEMRRVFVQAVWRKSAWAATSAAGGLA